MSGRTEGGVELAKGVARLGEAETDSGLIAGWTDGSRAPTHHSSLTLADAARIMREAVKNKEYRLYPIGGEAGAYLRWKCGVLTDTSYRDYESGLDKLARYFCDLELADLEPPIGTERLEEFLEHQWGEGAPRTYNKNRSILVDFFKWAVLKGKLHGDPTLPIRPRKQRDVHRESFNEPTILGILANGPSAERLRRDRIALRLLLRYGLRKGALQAIQFKHFDANRKRLTIFTKGKKIREVIIVHPEFWDDVAKLQLELDSSPDHYLMPRGKAVWRGYNDDGSSRFEYMHFPDKPMGDHGLHDWWYRCLTRAGLVQEGVTSGEKMHKARHTAGQRLLEEKGNIKAVQRLLGHASAQTTLDVYTDWDAEQLAESMEAVDK